MGRANSSPALPLASAAWRRRCSVDHPRTAPAGNHKANNPVEAEVLAASLHNSSSVVVRTAPRLDILALAAAAAVVVAAVWANWGHLRVDSSADINHRAVDRTSTVVTLRVGHPLVLTPALHLPLPFNNQAPNPLLRADSCHRVELTIPKVSSIPDQIRISTDLLVVPTTHQANNRATGSNSIRSHSIHNNSIRSTIHRGPTSRAMDITVRVREAVAMVALPANSPHHSISISKVVTTNSHHLQP